MRQVERFVMLEIVDRQWKDHLYSLDHLKEGIGLRGYGQKDPLVEYKRESFELFQDMKHRIDEDMVNRLWIGQFTVVGDEAPQRPQRRAAPPMMLNEPHANAEPGNVFGAARPSAAPGFPARPTGLPSRPAGLPSRPAAPPRVGGDDAPIHTVRRDEPKVGRNDPCPCGSGKKYKKCHGVAA
jgi:preprotein translocase subunit SecA